MRRNDVLLSILCPASKKRQWLNHFLHICQAYKKDFFTLKLLLLHRMNAGDDLQTRWWQLEAKLIERFGKKPDMEAVLFLIGMQETGFVRSKITKEQKQDLMHVAVCTLLSESGYYIVEGKDEEGWPHFKQIKEIPSWNVVEQENILKDHALLYFEKHNF